MDQGRTQVELTRGQTACGHACDKREAGSDPNRVDWGRTIDNFSTCKSFTNLSAPLSFSLGPPLSLGWVFAWNRTTWGREASVWPIACCHRNIRWIWFMLNASTSVIQFPKCFCIQIPNTSPKIVEPNQIPWFATVLAVGYCCKQLPLSSGVQTLPRHRRIPCFSPPSPIQSSGRPLPFSLAAKP
jgi:hypothetical protein